MNPPTPAELQAQMHALKAEMECRVQIAEATLKNNEKRFDRIETILEAQGKRIDQLSDRILTTAIGTIVTIITSMTFILNYGTPLALLRNLPKEVVTAPVKGPAPASLPDAKPAKDHAEKVVR